MKYNFILFISSLLSFSADAAGSGDFLKDLDYEFGIEYKDSNNPIKTSQAFEGKGLSYNAHIGGFIGLQNNLFLIPAIGINKTKYNEKLISDNLDKEKLQTGLGLTYFITDLFEIGGDITYQFIRGRQIDPTTTSGIAGADDKFNIAQFSLYGQTNWEYIELGISLSKADKKAKTRSFNELSDYYDDSYKKTNFGTNARIELFNRSANFEILYFFEKKKHIKRSARYSAGTIDNTQSINPKKEFHTHNIQLKSEVSLLGVSFKVAAVHRIQNDRVFDAEDSVKNSLAFSASYPLIKDLVFTLSYNRNKESYDNFSSVWIGRTANPSNEKRIDESQSLELEISYQLVKNTHLKFSFTNANNESNYKDSLNHSLKGFDEKAMGLQLNIKI